VIASETKLRRLARSARPAAHDQGPPTAEAEENDSSLRARALGSLYLAGATIGLISLLLPHSSRADDVGLYSNVGLAFAGGIALLALRSRLPGWTMHVAVITGSLLITRAVVLSHDPVSFYSVWFIWVGLYAFYFFGRVTAAGYVALVAGLYAFTLAHAPASSPVARWLTTVATLIVAGVFIDTLVRRAQRQASAASASAGRMALIATVAHELAGVSDSAGARPALCQAAAGVTHAERVALWEPSDDGSSLLLTASCGRAPARRAIPFVGPPAGAPQAFTSGRMAFARDAKTARRLSPEFAGPEDPPGVCLWQPIVRNQAPIAVLGIYWDDPAALADQSLPALADLLAAEVAATLERVSLLARLETIARTDELTGLPNRRAWQEELPRELARAQRTAEPMCVAMLDLDHFKIYNDERGHLAGDRLLKEVAGAWTGQLRETDILARYGGEEFALVLPSCTPEGALEIVERLRAVTPSGQTCSAGISTWDGTGSAGELIEQADGALYDAKRSGRNQTTLAVPIGPT
jgi:diguanylate cyclase (GGDEF)-like protein